MCRPPRDGHVNKYTTIYSRVLILIFKLKYVTDNIIYYTVYKAAVPEQFLTRQIKEMVPSNAKLGYEQIFDR